MTKDDLFFLRKTYKDQVVHYIAHNIDSFMTKIVDEGCFTPNDRNEILCLLLEPISDIYKVTLLEFFPDEISIRGKNYSDEVVLHILEHNYDNSDLTYLM